MRVRVVGNVRHAGEDLERGQELDLPAVHCRALIRAGHLEAVEKKPRRKKKRKARASEDS